MSETMTITTKDGTTEDVESINGCRLLTVDDQGPQPSTAYLSNSGLDGQLDGPTTYGTRVISANFGLEGYDPVDYTLGCREIWEKLFRRDAFYLTWTRMPGFRYLVHTRPFQYSKLAADVAQFTVEFEAFRGLAESVGTTLDPFTYDAEKWQIGQHLPNGEDLPYVFTTNNFRVYNASNVPIDPVQRHELQIALTCEGTPTITNSTTGDVFKITQAVTKSDVLLIDGIYPYLNDQHCGRNTNHGLITLNPGWNDIEITGATNIDISWLFRYLYL